MPHSIEPLEARIAPATLTGRTLTYTDIDGDKVTITFTLGTYADTDFTFNTAFADPGKQQLFSMNFETDPDKAETNITMKVTKVAGGDGQAHVGFINAENRDLGAVTILGDLGRIKAGAVADNDPGVKSLKVASIGIFATNSQGGNGDNITRVVGELGFLEVKGNIDRAEINASSYGKITIGGSLIGGAADYSGQIFSSAGSMGDITIKGDLIGGGGTQSGTISSYAKIGKITIGGSVIGSSGQDAVDRFSGSGSIISGRGAPGDIPSITIGGRVEGGSGLGSGAIAVGTNVNHPSTVGALVIKGGLGGGAGNQSGALWVNGAAKSISVGSVTATSGHYDTSSDSLGEPQGQIYIKGTLGSLSILGDLRGGTGVSSGILQAEDNIGTVKIGGSIVAGDGKYRAAIYGQKSIGAVTIGGDIDGRFGSDSEAGILARDNIASVKVGGAMLLSSLQAGDQLGAVSVKGNLFGAIIIARGQMTQGATTDLAIKSLKVGGSVMFSKIIAGFDVLLTAITNGDAQIGAVTVNGDWLGSDLAAGAIQGAGGYFGDGNDTVAAGSAGIISRIASVTIKGSLYGTHSGISTSDHFGFVAQEIGTFSVGGQKLKLTPKVTDTAVPFSPITLNDVTLVELPV